MKILSLPTAAYRHALAVLALALLSAPAMALAGVTITYPGNGALVNSPFSGLTGSAILPQNSFSDNLVTVNGGNMNYAFGAGDAGSRALSNNTLILNGGTVRFDVFGAYSVNGGAATGNTVILNNGSVRAIYGAQSLNGGSVTGNSVTMNGGSASSSVTGGHSTNGIVVGNSAVLNNGSVGLDLTGGFGKEAINNSASVSGGSVAGDVHGGYGSTSATGNSVSISGGSIGGAVYGGHGASATGNSVSMSGGSVNGNIYGGYATGSQPVDASNNSVTISGGSVSGNIYGAYGTSDMPSDSTVTIADAARLSSQTLIYGTAQQGSTSAAHNLNNTLNIQNWRGIAGNVHNFDNYNFTLPEGMQPGDTALTLVGGSATDLDNTTIRHGSSMGGGTRFAVGDSVNLIQNAAGITTSSITLAGGRVQQGVSLVYDYDLSATSNAIQMTFTSEPQLLPQTQAVAQGRAASLGFVNMGADLAAGSGMDNARQAAVAGLSSGDTDNSWGIAAFAAASGGSLHYDVGGGTDVRGSSLMLGLAKTWQLAPVDVLVGAFFEAGFSNFDSDGHGVSGTGEGRYTGAGVLARMDVTQSLLQGLYVEASFRSGMQHSFYEGQGLTSSAGDTASYSTDSPYIGLHGGVGYVWQITDQAALDVYGKYFWTRQYGSDVRIMGDPYSFKDTDSQRVRAGARFSYELSEWFSPYIGAAYEHEFDGKSKVTAYGFDIPAPAVKGGTGVGELGVSFRPTAAQGLSIDLGVQGYTGKRSGVMGNLQVKLEF